MILETLLIIILAPIAFVICWQVIMFILAGFMVSRKRIAEKRLCRNTRSMTRPELVKYWNEWDAKNPGILFSKPKKYEFTEKEAYKRAMEKGLQ